jgi:hypothetical protein
VRWLERRRHSLTKKGDARGHGSHLPSAGVALARTLGSSRPGAVPDGHAALIVSSGGSIEPTRP